MHLRTPLHHSKDAEPPFHHSKAQIGAKSIAFGEITLAPHIGGGGGRRNAVANSLAPPVVTPAPANGGTRIDRI